MNVDTMLKDSQTPRYAQRRTHRTYTPQFKAELVAMCQKPGASIAAEALQHGMNANLLHRWLREQRLARQQTQQQTPAFVSLPLRAVVADDHVAQTATSTTPASEGQVIRMEIQRGSATITIAWPVTAAAQCAQTLRDWLR